MPTSRVTVTVNTAALRALIEALPGRGREAVVETAQAIRERAVQIAARDTGSMAASVYVNDGEDSDYFQRVGQALSLNRGVQIVPEVNPEFVMALSGGDTTNAAVVGVAAGHGIHVELGTRFMAAQPFMTPAVEPERDLFIQRMTQVADG